MEKTAVASIKQEDDWILVKSPYSARFVSRLKEEIHWKDREWDKPYWKVKPEHLEIVRAIVSEVAQSEGWEILDYTAQSLVTVEEHKQEIAQNDLDRHVAAVIDVLPKLPPRALRMVDWKEDYLAFELATFLDNKDLFRELSQASLESYRPTILWGGSKREFTQTFIVAADERILRKLCDYAGTFQSDNTFLRSNVEYFIVRQLSVKERFDDGIVHFLGNDGNLWVGIPYQKINWDLSWSHKSWQVTYLDATMYRAFNCEEALKELISVRESQYVNPGFGNVAIAQSHPSHVASFVVFTHLEAWFHQWGNDLAQSNELKASPFTKPAWYDFAWDHPADEMLSHISFTRRGGAEMAALLGWSKEDLTTYRERVKQLKRDAAQRVIDDMKARSGEFALPRLQSMTIPQLLELGQKHNVEVRKSWGKEKLVQVLNTQVNIREEIIGLTKRLGETHGSTQRK